MQVELYCDHCDCSDRKSHRFHLDNLSNWYRSCYSPYLSTHIQAAIQEVVPCRSSCTAITATVQIGKAIDFTLTISRIGIAVATPPICQPTSKRPFRRLCHAGRAVLRSLRLFRSEKPSISP